MKLLAQPQSGWIDPDAETEEGASASRVLDSRLQQLLGAERLMVLTGLGTSTGIAQGDGGPGMAALWSRARDAVEPDDWDYALEAAVWGEGDSEDIELLLSKCQMALALSGDDRLGEFIKTCEREIVEACSFVTENTPLPVHEMFLRRIARRPVRLPRTQLYTTNYDLAFEAAASRLGFALIDGFSHVYPQRFNGSYFDIDYAFRDRERAATPLEWMQNVFHLLKLHGSIDWLRVGQGVERRSHVERPLIIYPRSSKFETSYQQPFLELMARFQSGLRRPDTALLIIGSGLSADQHLAEPILSAVRSNVRLSVVVVSRSLSEKSDGAIASLKSFVEGGDRRVTLIESTFEDFVPKLPDLVPETEAEAHEDRTH